MSASSPSSRAAASIWGQFVGDAAALGTHWIYELNELAALFPEGVHGFEASRPGHYHEHARPGDQTHYGEAALLLLESVADQGGFDEADFGRRFVAHFGSAEVRAYRDTATKTMLAHQAVAPGQFQNGGDDDGMATVTRLAPVIAAHAQAGDETFFDAIRRATLVTQGNATALACAAAHGELLRALLMGLTLPEAFEQARRSPDVSCDTADLFEAAHTQLSLDVVAGTEFFGQSCSLLQSFPAALHAALKHADDFRAAILQTLRAGGDNAGRAAIVGAWLGAAGGMERLPQDWIAALSARHRIDAAVKKLTG